MDSEDLALAVKDSEALWEVKDSEALWVVADSGVPVDSEALDLEALWEAWADLEGPWEAKVSEVLASEAVADLEVKDSAALVASEALVDSGDLLVASAVKALVDLASAVKVSEVREDTEEETSFLPAVLTSEKHEKKWINICYPEEIRGQLCAELKLFNLK